MITNQWSTKEINLILVQTKPLKFASEIYWPLTGLYVLQLAPTKSLAP